MEYLTPLLGNIGTVIVLIILWKSGLLKFVLELKNGNSKEDRMEKLEQHFNHELTDALNRIERKLEKLDEIAENIVYIKARQNGK